ncbi:hypothetical protein B0T25DRAFT_546001 [Lasiosphaeria hispida]|uniref:Secreted protein n=1 Tax=Lasiosphaeria hispida TaxID=260671 RepID=A0AAJ0HDE4_9PEZI|nr:hypothetical protein B0T25DRAFT_546001 [Lasiosphaeria hispida]
MSHKVASILCLKLALTRATIAYRSVHRRCPTCKGGAGWPLADRPGQTDSSLNFVAFCVVPLPPDYIRRVVEQY